MKEFLVNHNNEWTLQLLDADTEENSFRVAVPSGAEILTERGNYKAFWKIGAVKFIDADKDWDFNYSLTVGGYLNMWRGEVEIVWQRHTQPEELPFIDDEPKSLNDTYAEIEQVRQETVKVTIDELKHRVYKKDVSHLDSIDVYRVLELFNVQSHAVGHAIKKLLCSGGRGAKDEAQDIQEAIDSLVRYQEMKNEDE